MRRVYTLPAAQGDVPLFKDKLTWPQIADLTMRWSSGGSRALSFSKILAALRSLTSPRQLFVYAVFALTMVKYRFLNLFRGKKSDRPEMRIDT